MVVTVAVIGSRGFEPLSKVKDYLDSLKGLVPEFWVVTGGAQGVDTAAMLWCDVNGMKFKVIRPRNENRREEYLYRNVHMLAMSDYVVAFWDGSSAGTAFGIQYAKDKGIPVRVVLGGDIFI